MISVEDACTRLISGLKPLAVERLEIGQCLGRVLANDVCAALTCPPRDVSSMDGYAVRAADTRQHPGQPVTLKQIGMSRAGAGFAETMGPGETVRIFTGAPLPPGADAVVMQENTVPVSGSDGSDNSHIQVRKSAEPGLFVRPRGLDISEGDVLRTSGHRLGARDLGLLASANIAKARVYRRPCVGYLATGDELVMPGDPVGDEQIISSNSIAMDACITAFGGIPLSLGIAKDTAESLKQALAKGTECDFLVTMGGASVGDFDLVRSVLGEAGPGEAGLDLSFWKVAMRPGKPLIFGHYNGIPVLGLPGNPVSSGVTALLFLRPAIERLQGMPMDPASPVPLTMAILGEDMADNDERQDYVRARLDVTKEQGRVATPLGHQDSSMMSRLADSDCLIVREPRAPRAHRGEEVSIIELPRTTFAY